MSAEEELVEEELVYAKTLAASSAAEIPDDAPAQARGRTLEYSGAHGRLIASFPTRRCTRSRRPSRPACASSATQSSLVIAAST